MIKEVRSFGGSLLMVETRLWPKWGGVDSNSATHGETNDYEFAFKVNSYLGILQIEGGSVIILNDMPMDTTVIYNKRDQTMDIVRVMNSDFPEIEEIIAQYLKVDQAHMHPLPKDDVDTITFLSSSMILADSTCTAEHREKGIGDYLEFDVPSLTCSITSYECDTPQMRLIIHQIKGV